MTLHVKDGGTWKTVTPSVKDGGSWKSMKEVWVKVAGAWALVYSSVTFALPFNNDVDASFGVTASVVCTLTSAGAYSVVGSSAGIQESGNWISSGAPGSYTIRAHVSSGATPTGSALDTDLALSSNRSWTLSQSTVGSTTCTLLLTLKDGGGNTVKTSTITMTPQRIS